jgi:hypothetical protein
MPEDPTDELVRQCLHHLRELPFVRRANLRAAKGTRDSLVLIYTPNGRHELPCEIHRVHLSQSSAQALVLLAKRRAGTIVLAPAVGREVAQLFEQQGVNFVDSTGNCYLRLSDRYIARIQGRRAPAKSRTDRGLRAPAYRVLFALLVKPELVGASSRAIAAECDVSPQTANDLRTWLVEHGLIFGSEGRRRWDPARRKDVLALWLAGFTTTVVPSLIIGRFRARDRDPGELERRIEPELDGICDWRYGGGAAAMRLTKYYRGDRTLIYVRDAPPDLPSRLKLARDDASGPITLQRPPGRAAFESPNPRTVHPLLAYSDLLAEGHDRAREAAAALYDKYLSATEQAS